MRLRHIEVFHAVMKAGTINGAAQVLHVSQPAVTKVLQHCEQQIGIVLFDRVKGKLHPTPEARRLFIEVEKMHQDLSSIRRLVDSMRIGDSERVRLVATPTLGATVVPAALTLWSKALATARCDLSTNHTREIVTSLLVGEADLALSLQDPQHPSIKAEVLASGAMMALCPAGTPEAATSGPLSASDIRSEMISLSNSDPLGGLVTASLDAPSSPFRSRISVQTYQMARALAESGVGMTVIDPFTTAMADPALVKVRRMEPAIPVHLYLLTPQGAPLNQAAKRLVKFIGQVAREQLASVEAGLVA